MATKIKVGITGDFLEVIPEGIIDINTSKQLFTDIAKTQQRPKDYVLLIDFRDTLWQMSKIDVYQLASELCLYGDTFRRKVAVLVLPGVNFGLAAFLETCSHNRGFLVDAFTDLESAMRWVISLEDESSNATPPNRQELQE
jgi:hypothetical protein